jgi:hypothetical protein
VTEIETPTPDPRAYSEVLDQILAGLQVAAPPPQREWVTSVELSQKLRTMYGIGIHWRTIDGLLGKEKGLVVRRKRGARWQYQLLSRGEERLTGSGGQTVIIDPEKAIKAVSSVHALLCGMKGIVRLCDPYVDHSTIEHLAAVPKDVPIRILTVNIQEANRLRRVLAAARTEGRQVELRVAQGAKLHDRFVIDDAKMLLLGTSLNGLGKKLSFVVRAGPDIREPMAGVFDGHWAAGIHWA